MFVPIFWTLIPESAAQAAPKRRGAPSAFFWPCALAAARPGSTFSGLATRGHLNYPERCRRHRRWGRPLMCLPCAAWRVLEQQSGQRACGQPQQQQPEQPEQQLRFPCCVFVHVFLFLPGRGARGRLAGMPSSPCEPRHASGIVRRPRFAGRGGEGKMARARPVRTARRCQAVGRIENRGAGRIRSPGAPPLPRPPRPTGSTTPIAHGRRDPGGMIRQRNS